MELILSVKFRKKRKFPKNPKKIYHYWSNKKQRFVGNNESDLIEKACGLVFGLIDDGWELMILSEVSSPRNLGIDLLGYITSIQQLRYAPDFHISVENTCSKALTVLQPRS